MKATPGPTGGHDCICSTNAVDRWTHLPGEYQRKIRRDHPPQRDCDSQLRCIQGDMRGSTHRTGEIFTINSSLISHEGCGL